MQLLIVSYAAEQALDRPVIGRHWKANSATRMMELLHATGVPLGLVTNGEHWMLVFAPRGETTGYASWYSALWLDEPITLRAFHSLLGVRRFFGVAADSTLLGLLKESAQDQQEVTDQLGYQVREAVEVLVQAFDTLDQDSNRNLLKGVSETALYEAALTVMMRLVFLFSAEERGLLHLGKPLYDDNYAVSTLMEELQETADLYGPQVLERRFDAWARLLATFRAVHAGVHHQDLLIPAYGGSLFDPDRYPFLEGRGMGTNWATTQAEPLAVNNRVALHLLTSLQKLRIRVPGGGPSEARRISFRALGVEQIGHVYEGLLDHTAVHATEPVLGLKGTRDKKTEVPLIALEAALSQSQDRLIDFLKEKTGRSVSALKRAMDDNSPYDEHRLLIACGHDAGLFRRILPFAGLIREDSFERPEVVLPGSVYVTAGTTRRSTGTHYTPPSLTEPIVQYTLEPLVYQGPAEGSPREQWQLKSPKEILDLKVCDMAMGSGAFLVQVCRYLAERLTEAWENEEKKHPDEMLATPEGGFSQGAPSERLVPQDAAERLAIARRIVADRCLYGVDINQMAVEMAKLSLWLITLDAKRPFTFLDHAFKCGDSLLGLSDFKQLENFSLRPEGGKQIAFSTMNLWRHIEEATKKREALEAMPSDTPEQIGTKVALYSEAEEAVAKLNAAADVLVALELKDLKGGSYDTEREAAADHMMTYWQQGVKELRGYAQELLNGRRTLNWPLAFPEIMEHGGFDAFVGNPPFMGGTRLEPAFGIDYRAYLVDRIAKGVRGLRGAADLCSYFFLRAITLLNRQGCAGLIATNSIAQGDSALVGLEQILEGGSQIFRAVSSLPWPGVAATEVCLVWLAKERNAIKPILDDHEVTSIGPHLSPDSGAAACVLTQNSDQAFEGAKTAGLGFVLSEQEAQRILVANPANAEVLKPYLNGEDVNTHPSHKPSRWIINFRDMPLARRGKFHDAEYCAEDFPDCLTIIEARVKPERMLLEGRTSQERSLKERWWQFYLWRPALASALANCERALVSSRVTAHHNFAFVSTRVVFSDRLVVIARQDWGSFAIISSSIHGAWAHRPGATTHETRLTYLPTWAYATFPFPDSMDGLLGLAERYHDFRRQLMLTGEEGLTKTYNRFHDRCEKSEGIAQLRSMHIEMDQAVATAYGWKDFNLDHGFHETKQGLRYTISENARREILDRLLALNHQCHVEEKAARATIGARSRPAATRRGKAKTDGIHSTPDLFDSKGGRA